MYLIFHHLYRIKKTLFNQNPNHYVILPLTFISSVLISASLFATTVTVDNLIYDIDSKTLTATLTRDNSNSAITSADIPASVSVDGVDYAVTAIGDWAFYGCRSMTSVSIPASIRSIGAFAFASCTALERVSVSDLGAWCGITFGNGYANPLMCGRNLYLDDTRRSRQSHPRHLHPTRRRPHRKNHCQINNAKQ